MAKMLKQQAKLYRSVLGLLQQATSLGPVYSRNGSLSVLEPETREQGSAGLPSHGRLQGKILPASSSFQGPQVFLGFWLHHSSLCPIFTLLSPLVHRRNESDFLEDLQKSRHYPSEMLNIS